MKETRFWGRVFRLSTAAAMAALAFGMVFLGCASGPTVSTDQEVEATLTNVPITIDEVAEEDTGTVWFGRRETPATFSYEISGNTITWTHNLDDPIVLTKEGATYSSGGSLVGTVWYNENEDFRLEFIDATNVKSSWGPLDYITYTLVGNTINFDYTRVREGTLTFKENSTFQFKDRNTLATGTSKVEGNVITLNGVWENGDAGAGTKFEVSGTVSGGTITLTNGVFWGIKIFNKQ